MFNVNSHKNPQLLKHCAQQVLSFLSSYAPHVISNWHRIPSWLILSTMVMNACEHGREPAVDHGTFQSQFV
jgi:hypothetical protein